MTDEEKSSLGGDMRIRYVRTGRQPHRADIAPHTAKGGMTAFAAAAAIGAVCLLAPDKALFAAQKGGYALYRLSAACARLELEGLSGLAGAFEDISANNTAESGNTFINEGNTGGTLVLSGDDANIVSYGAARMPSSENEEPELSDTLPLPAADSSTPLPYPSDIEDNDGRISSVTYGMGSGENYIDLPLGGQIRNATSLDAREIYESACLMPDFSIKLNADPDEPQVLIMHTHTTESYEPYTRDFYDADFLCRTTDESRNMAAVGEAMTRVLEQRGVRTLHDTTIHDYPSYNGSYDRSRETVTALLERYPSIKVVLDVHRDAIERESGERIAPSAVINGKSSAQVMIICGCDDGTMGMPDCMKNLRTASLFEQQMESRFSGLTRPVLFDYRQYNQDLTTGSLLIEVGGHANSLSQAVYAGELAAEGIADALYKLAASDGGSDEPQDT